MSVQPVVSKKHLAAQHLHNWMSVLKQAFTETKEGILKAGKALYMIRQEKLWKASGSPAKSFVHWVENEIGISKSTAYAHIEAYEKLGDILVNGDEFKTIEMSKVFLLLPYITNEMTVNQKEELLHMAMHTTWQGLRDNLKEKAGKLATDKCDHQDTELVERCKCCGKWLK